MTLNFAEFDKAMDPNYNVNLILDPKHEQGFQR